MDAPANGVTNDAEGTDYEATVTFSCNIGYDLLGADSRTCLASGLWSVQTASVCNRKGKNSFFNCSNLFIVYVVLFRSCV